jgi:hypothetical protein
MTSSPIGRALRIMRAASLRRGAPILGALAVAVACLGAAWTAWAAAGEFQGRLTRTPKSTEPIWLYVVQESGDLTWYRQDSATAAWSGPKKVGNSWNGFKHVIPAGGNIVYGITASGDVRWNQHDGFNTGTPVWKASTVVGHGWNVYSEVFGGSDGVVYAIKPDGTLYWYQHGDYKSGRSELWHGPRQIGTGWNGFAKVFSMGGGIIYGVKPNGDLIWHKHEGFHTGENKWATSRQVASGWSGFSKLLAAGDGIILGIKPDGSLWWHKHTSYQTGVVGRSTRAAWEQSVQIGSGWKDFYDVFALLPEAAVSTRQEAERRRAWHTAMMRAPLPKKGCFNVTYPTTAWEEVSCVQGPENPSTVGNTTDFAATVAAGNQISSATGSFDSVTGVTSETGTTFGSGCLSPVPNVADIFSLQLNTNRFTTKTTSVPGCATAAGCQAWQQFIFGTAPAPTGSGNTVYMQYWLFGYATGGRTCPSGWRPGAPPPNSCFLNSTATPVPAQTIANLGSMSLTASAGAGFDTVKLLTTGDVPSISASNQDSVLNLAQGWQGAEFNVFGDTCGPPSQAVFNPGSTIVVRLQVNSGANIVPACQLGNPGTFTGWTGETNNLNLVGTPAAASSSSPAIVFTQSYAAGTAASCASIKRGLSCIGVSSSGSTSCKDAGGVDSTCATATCPPGSTLTGGGGSCAAGDRKIKSLFPRASNGTFNIACEQQGVDPQAIAICCKVGTSP